MLAFVYSHACWRRGPRVCSPLTWQPPPSWFIYQTRNINNMHTWKSFDNMIYIYKEDKYALDLNLMKIPVSAKEVKIELRTSPCHIATRRLRSRPHQCMVSYPFGSLLSEIV